MSDKNKFLHYVGGSTKKVIDLSDIHQCVSEIVDLRDLIAPLASRIRWDGVVDGCNVLSHCINLCTNLERKGFSDVHCVYALLHDVEESLTGDIPTGFKSLVDNHMHDFVSVTAAHIRDAIISRFCPHLSILDTTKEDVHVHDKILGLCEAYYAGHKDMFISLRENYVDEPWIYEEHFHEWVLSYGHTVDDFMTLLSKHYLKALP